jgi:uncharacterized protein involved in response to NO
LSLVATAPHAACREPYRSLFPLGAVLAAVAVLPFAAGGAGGGSLALFHSVAQIQGFLTCFLVAFLYTFVPRRTQTAAPAPWQMIAALVLPPLAVACAFAGKQALAQGTWLALVAVVLGFTARRLLGAHGMRTLPPVFLWVPVSLAAGACGAVLIAASSQLDAQTGPAAWAVGRGLLVQGLVAGLVLGVGGILVPQLTRGEPWPATLEPGRQRRALAWHGLGAVAFFASFPIEVIEDVRLGGALRALVAFAVLIRVARIHRRPTVPGLHRRLVWAAAWLVPLGFCMGALVPRLRGAALHVVFVGGFAQLTLAVSTHVVLSHGGRPERLDESPWAMRAMAALLAAAFAGRILAGIDLRRVPEWLSVAALAFLGALAAWGAVVGPTLGSTRLGPRPGA